MRTCSRASLCVRDWGAQPPAWLLLLPTASVIRSSQTPRWPKPRNKPARFRHPRRAQRNPRARPCSGRFPRGWRSRAPTRSSYPNASSPPPSASAEEPRARSTRVRRRSPDYTPKAVEIAALSVTQIPPSARSPPLPLPTSPTAPAGSSSARSTSSHGRSATRSGCSC